MEDMARTDEADLLIDASSARVFTALLDPDALVRWLPPGGMTGRMERFEPRPGGRYRMILRYDDPAAEEGKSGGGEDVVEATFVEIEQGERVIQDVEFASDDPAFGGVMRMSWLVTAEGDRARVTIRAENVPEGVSEQDHLTGLRSSLQNLSALVGR